MNTGVGRHSLYQSIFQSQGWNLHLLHLLHLLQAGSLPLVPLQSVPFTSVAQSCPTLCDPMNHSTLDLPVHYQLPEFTQTQSMESVMPSSHLILCRPLLLLNPVPLSIRVFSNKSTLRMRWPKYCSFSINPYNEYSGLISFRMDWLDLLVFSGCSGATLETGWEGSGLEEGG